MPKKIKMARRFSLKNTRSGLEQKIPFPKLLYTSFGICFLTMTFSYIVWNRLPPEIPLYYGLPNGTGQIAEKSRIIVPSTAAVSFIVLNTIITVIVNNQFLKKLLVITGFVLSIFALTTTLEIIFLVGNI